jgi:membrane protease YdiL (CAAX protease family)
MASNPDGRPGETVNHSGPEDSQPVHPNRVFPALAWVGIVILVGIIITLNTLVPTSLEEDTEEDSLGLLMMRLQARYIVGTSLWTPDSEKIYDASAVLNIGTIPQRQRYIVLAAELSGPAEAARLLSTLDEMIRQETLLAPDTVTYTDSDQQIQQILHRLYTDLTPATLSPADTDLLLERLDWFGELALNPTGGLDEAARDEVMASSTRVFFILIAALIAGILAMGLGLVMLVTVIVLGFTGRLSSGFERARSRSGIYAETFAIWIGLFFILQFAASVLPTGMLGSAIAFFASLLALYWPVMRGVAWIDVRHDIGLTYGRRPALEPLVGIGGYLMALPLLAVGVLCTLLLMTIQSFILGPPPVFAPGGAPAHPIVLELADGSLWVKLQILLLASVAAPIVEETMFRGVLYRHLRDATSHWGIALSVFFSATLNGLLFAAIHPQGWVAIPALMALAYSFLLLREWRGTLVPAIIVHGISNGVVMLTLLAVLSG